MSAPVLAPPTDSSVRDTTLTRRRRRPAETLFKAALLACLFLAFTALAALLAWVIAKGWNRLDSRLWTEMPTGLVSRLDTAGVQSALVGTLWIITLVAVICLPIGILAAIYLEEYAEPTRWYNRLLELNIQNLAGVPSIIFGILGLGIVARALGLGFTVTTAGIVLSLLVLPVVIIASREAIRAVPQSIRQASYALGATKWQTISRQVLPSAVPGIATGSILALSRAIGEAAPLIVLGAATMVTFNPDGFDSAYTALPIQIYQFITRPQAGFTELAAAAIVLLLAIVVVMNSVAILVRNRYEKRW